MKVSFLYRKKCIEIWVIFVFLLQRLDFLMERCDVKKVRCNEFFYFLLILYLEIFLKFES